ncbi:EpsG family protein [Chitinophaga pendula]|uniref:EpsG family protein n=1 Tax=Chitinophaga TaxID=79328 RepID=UPI000BAF2826|nr:MULTISPECIES: EpsG family protein [Chitinophaga]ASZ10695.1 hypothetical protein CK934_06725 [Chitinophaga sp. MD30]UCJ06332.1 EpsG family protein [Chitinophaga pendula]
MFYLVPFIGISIFCLFDIEAKDTRTLVFGGICICLILLAGFRGDSVDKDYPLYLEYFNAVPAGITFTAPEGYLAEPFYTFIPSLVKLIGLNVACVFFIYALLGVSIKSIVIVRSTPFIFLALLVYYSNFFLLHEMTQIRIGVAFGIFLLGIPFIIERRLFPYTCLILLAVCFHFSATIYWGIYFLGHRRFNKIFYTSLLVLVLPIAILKIDMLSILRVLPLGVFTEKIEFYYGAMSDGTFESTINVLNVMTLVNIFLCIICVWKIDLLQKHFVYAALFVKMYIISLLLFVCFSFMPPLAFRFKELFEAVQILLIPQLVFLFREKYTGRLVVVAISFILFFINVFHTELVKAYF